MKVNITFIFISRFIIVPFITRIPNAEVKASKVKNAQIAKRDWKGGAEIIILKLNSGFIRNISFFIQNSPCTDQ